ncbi:hypothetical protein J2Y03_004178 [Neobacillus niacini]|uniref:hypothetical protein n=1 Tax=Neobacillus niacini TaxID=86668 RepID=UPI002866C2FE|nr:hypothetical protein [Neobacillus niacini]MDR7079121.1 hypothetical protein [Neobacillus niacini]
MNNINKIPNKIHYVGLIERENLESLNILRQNKIQDKDVMGGKTIFRKVLTGGR